MDSDCMKQAAAQEAAGNSRSERAVADMDPGAFAGDKHSGTAAVYMDFEAAAERLGYRNCCKMPHHPAKAVQSEDKSTLVTHPFWFFESIIQLL